MESGQEDLTEPIIINRDSLFVYSIYPAVRAYYMLFTYKIAFNSHTHPHTHTSKRNSFIYSHFMKEKIDSHREEISGPKS